MKISKARVQQIIKEETLKVKELIVLQEQRNILLKQINEIYEDENVEEGFLGFGKTPEEKIEAENNKFKNSFEAKKVQLIKNINKALATPAAKKRGLKPPAWAQNKTELAYAVLAAMYLQSDTIALGKDGKYKAGIKQQATNGIKSINSGISKEELRIKFPNYAIVTGE